MWDFVIMVAITAFIIMALSIVYVRMANQSVVQIGKYNITRSWFLWMIGGTIAMLLIITMACFYR